MPLADLEQPFEGLQPGGTHTFLTRANLEALPDEALKQPPEFEGVSVQYKDLMVISVPSGNGFNWRTRAGAFFSSLKEAADWWDRR